VENKFRQESYKKDTRLEAKLQEVNGLLGKVEKELLKDFNEPKFPAVIIVGAPRSGTTLLLQWLAASGNFAYPSNLLSRFYSAPFIGAKIQKVLADYDTRSEIFGAEKRFTSLLGKTEGALNVNEFWYFWRRFFKAKNEGYFTDEELKKADVKNFKAELAAIVEEFEKPFAMKGLIFNWNADYLATQLRGKSIFIHIERNVFDNAASLLEARKEFFGDVKRWYSFMIPQFEKLRNENPFFQVVAQVYLTNERIKNTLGKHFEKYYLHVKYEDLCENSANVWEKLREKLSDIEFDLPKREIHEKFTVKEKNIDDTAMSQFTEALKRLKNKEF